MVSVRRRKMNRSGVSKNRRKNNNKDKFNPKSNPIIAKHWDPELTAKQNYKKLGLTFRLAAASGGVEKKIKINPINRGNMEESLYEVETEKVESEDENENEDEDEDPYDPANILEGTAKLLKDDNGNVIKIIYGTKKITVKPDTEDMENLDSNYNNHKGDNDEDDDYDEDKSTANQVIAELEELASLPKKKEVHKMNELEIYRYKKLIEKYGEDYEKMKWDKKLNPFQLSPGQIRKQIIKYKSIYD